VAHTHRLDIVSERIKDLIEAQKVPLTVDDVFYGDQEIVPHARTVCVEPVTVNRSIVGAPDMVQNTFTVAVLVYVYKVQELQATRAEADALSGDIEDLLHTTLQLQTASPGSDIIIHGFVMENLSGYTVKQSRLYRSCRLTWQGISKTSLRFGP
jgi:hypothetical protein